MNDDYSANRREFDKVVEVLRKTLHFSDSMVPMLLMVLAAVVANQLPGIAVWIAIIAASSAGKTSMFLDPLSGLDCTADLDDATLPGLLAGKNGPGTGGVLMATKDGDVFLLKDLSVLMGMAPVQRKAVYSALRRVFERKYSRHTGDQGGAEFIFEGKRGMIAAGTHEVYKWVEEQGELGERITGVKMPDFTAEDRAARALKARRSERGMDWDEMVAEREQSINTWRRNISLPETLPYPDEGSYSALEAWAAIGARLRSNVLRDNHTRDIEDTPKYEEPTRLQEQLDQLTGALIVVGARAEEIVSVWQACAFGGCKPDRLAVVLALLGRHQEVTTAAVTGFARLGSDTNAQRHLEDLFALEMVERSGLGLQHNPYLWRISDLFLDWWNTANGALSSTPTLTEPELQDELGASFGELDNGGGPDPSPVQQPFLIDGAALERVDP